MATLRTDPLRNFKFRVSISPNDVAGDGNLEDLAKSLSTLGFAQMSGIAVTNEVIPYREGGMNTHPHKMVGQSDFAPVSLARGVFACGRVSFRRSRKPILAYAMNRHHHHRGQSALSALRRKRHCHHSIRQWCD